MQQRYTSFRPEIGTSDFSALEYWIRKKLEDVNTIKLCRITKKNDDGSYDVETLVNEINPYTNQGEPLQLKSLPLLRVQGGGGGFIIENAPGDIVLVGFSDRDIQAAARSKDFAAPGTALLFPLSAGIILGAVLYDAPAVSIKATDKVYITGDTTSTGEIETPELKAETAEISTKLDIGPEATVEVAGVPGVTTSFTDAGGNIHTVVNGIITS